MQKVTTSQLMLHGARALTAHVTAVTASATAFKQYAALAVEVSDCATIMKSSRNNAKAVTADVKAVKAHAKQSSHYADHIRLVNSHQEQS
jgi:hypothetical protein